MKQLNNHRLKPLCLRQQVVEKRTETPNFVIPARPPWMAEVLETQEQFQVQAGIQDVDETIDFNSWTPAYGMTNPCFQQPVSD